jgi:hypothetical protein
MQFAWRAEASDVVLQLPVAPELKALAQSPVYSPAIVVQDLAGQAKEVVVASAVVVVVAFSVVVVVAVEVVGALVVVVVVGMGVVV